MGCTLMYEEKFMDILSGVQRDLASIRQGGEVGQACIMELVAMTKQLIKVVVQLQLEVKELQETIKHLEAGPGRKYNILL